MRRGRPSREDEDKKMSLRLVNPGSVIERVYYVVPEDYSIGTEYPDFISARDAAIARYHAIYEQVAAGYPASWDATRVAEIAHKAAAVKAVVDLRWVIKDSNGVPNGVTSDSVIERINVAHMATRKVPA